MASEDIYIGSGPAWLRAIQYGVLPLLTPKGNTRKELCKKGTQALGKISNDMIVLVGQLSSETISPDDWERIHKKSHEAWELSRLLEPTCKHIDLTVLLKPTQKRKAPRKAAPTAK